MKKRITEQFVQSLNAYQAKGAVPVISDLYVRYDEQSGETTLLDDAEEEILRIPLLEKISPEQFDELISEVVRTQEFADAIERMEVLKPFSVVWVNDKFDHLKEIITFDDENIIIDSSFLNKYNNDLDQFLKHLMEE